MRKREKTNTKLVDEYDRQDMEDQILNYGGEKQGTFPVGLIVIACLLIGTGIGTLATGKSDEKIEARQKIDRTQVVAEQSVARSAKSTASFVQNISAPEENSMNHVYVNGYNEDLTNEAHTVLATIYPDVPGTSYDELLTQACKDGVIESQEKSIAKENASSDTVIYVSCVLDKNYDREMLEYGLSNEYMKQDSVTAYWIGAVAEDDGYRIYMIFEK